MGTVDTRTRPMTGADIYDLRMRLGATNTDMVWLLGQSSINWRVTGEASKVPLNPVTSLTIRVLDTWPELNPLPAMPAMEDVLNLAAEAWPGPRRLTARKFGLMMGNSGWAGSSWARGNEPSVTAQRLMYYLAAVLVEQGQEGMEQFLEMVDAEARGRGLSGITELFRAKVGTWPKRKDRPASD